MLGLRRSEVCGYACVSPRIVMDRRPQSAMEMTMNVYGHINLNSQREALDHLDDSRPEVPVAVDGGCQELAVITDHVPDLVRAPPSDP